MSKYERDYCVAIAEMNLMFKDGFSKRFLEQVSGPITDIIFDYMKNNEPGFVKFLKEVDSDEII